MKIELQEIGKRYGRTRALERVSCILTPGQIIGIVGANGAGKTTLLRCLAGIVRPGRGEILYDGEVFRRDRLDLRRRLHFVPDFPFLFWELDLVQHASMALRLYGTSVPGYEERFTQLLADFDLLPLARRKLGTLSRGQIYKAGLVILMMVDPELWLLDEPFASGMDPQGIDAFRQRARGAAGRGRTVVFSTQLLDLAENFSDRVCILHRGALHLCETVAALAARNAGDGGALQQIFRQLRAGGT